MGTRNPGPLQPVLDYEKLKIGSVDSTVHGICRHVVPATWPKNETGKRACPTNVSM